MGIELSRLFVPLEPGGLEPVVASNALELGPPLREEHLVVAPSYSHARKLARARALEPGDGGACFLMKLEVVTAYLQRLEPRVVGRGDEVELWIPRAAFPGFNRRIARPMRLLHAFYGPGYAGRALPGHSLFGDDIHLFLAILDRASAIDLTRLSSAERLAERYRLMHQRRLIDLRRRARADASNPERLAHWTRQLERLGREQLEEAWVQAVGLRALGRPEGSDEHLLRAARLWLLGNLAFWRITGQVGRARLLQLAERLHRRFPHPAPTLRGTLVD